MIFIPPQSPKPSVRLILRIVEVFRHCDDTFGLGTQTSIHPSSFHHVSNLSVLPPVANDYWYEYKGVSQDSQICQHKLTSGTFYKVPFSQSSCVLLAQEQIGLDTNVNCAQCMSPPILCGWIDTVFLLPNVTQTACCASRVNIFNLIYFIQFRNPCCNNTKNSRYTHIFDMETLIYEMG